MVGMPQTAISRLESSNYGKPTITTLRRMARVYDVGLDVRFVPFGQLVDRLSNTPRLDMGLTSDSIDVPSYEEETERGLLPNEIPIETPAPAKQIEWTPRFVTGPRVQWDGKWKAEDSAIPIFRVCVKEMATDPFLKKPTESETPYALQTKAMATGGTRVH
jgi:transcriptional regulator with XRE-family HTH domain